MGKGQKSRTATKYNTFPDYVARPNKLLYYNLRHTPQRMIRTYQKAVAQVTTFGTSGKLILNKVLADLPNT